MDEKGNVIVPETVSEEVIGVEEKPAPKKFLGLKIASIVLSCVVMGIMIWWFVSMALIPFIQKENAWQLSVVLYLLYFLLMFSSAGVLINAIVGIVGTALSFKKKNNCTQGTKKTFLLFTILPLALEIVFIITTFIIANIK